MVPCAEWPSQSARCRTGSRPSQQMLRVASLRFGGASAILRWGPLHRFFERKHGYDPRRPNQNRRARNFRCRDGRDGPQRAGAGDARCEDGKRSESGQPGKPLLDDRQGGGRRTARGHGYGSRRDVSRMGPVGPRRRGREQPHRVPGRGGRRGARQGLGADHFVGPRGGRGFRATSSTTRKPPTFSWR